MKTATIREAQDDLPRLLELVRAGETVTITDAGTPVARLVRTEEAVDWEERLERLEREGKVKRGSGNAPKLAPLPDPIVPSGVLDALLEERREGW